MFYSKFSAFRICAAHGACNVQKKIYLRLSFKNLWPKYKHKRQQKQSRPKATTTTTMAATTSVQAAHKNKTTNKVKQN